MDYSEDLAYKRVRKRVKAIRGFYYSLMCYCIVIPILIYVNLTYSPQFYWFFFSACGWGIGLVFQAMMAFNAIPFTGKEWEDKKIKELILKNGLPEKQGTFSPTPQEQAKLDRVLQRIKAIKGFYKHLIVYILVNIFLITAHAFNLETGEKFFTFHTFSTAFYWGIGLALHAVSVFSPNVWGTEWEERKFQQIINKQSDKLKN